MVPKSLTRRLVGAMLLVGCSASSSRTVQETGTQEQTSPTPPPGGTGSTAPGPSPISPSGTNRGGDGELAGTRSGHDARVGAPMATAGASSRSTEASSDSSAAPPSTGESETGSGSPSIKPGTLTAGSWDDNRNFEWFLGFRKSSLDSQPAGVVPFEEAEHRGAYDAFRTLPGPKATLDVAMVIDTTGSMGDEIRYLQTEFLAITAAIESKYPNAQQRWSLVAYRDTSDDYVVRWFDFRTGDHLTEFKTHLDALSAGGGGDYPEAPDKALDKLSDLSWREGSTARMAFWVADAPHHAENAGAMAAALRKARQAGVHIYPVASSGTDALAELTMRQAAQLTGGRYLFLTDDSGVGGAHMEPKLPCYFVTKLDRALLRMVDIELSGVYREPDSADILRTGGDPKNGACTMRSGQVLYAF